MPVPKSHLYVLPHFPLIIILCNARISYQVSLKNIMILLKKPELSREYFYSWYSLSCVSNYMYVYRWYSFSFFICCLSLSTYKSRGKRERDSQPVHEVSFSYCLNWRQIWIFVLTLFTTSCLYCTQYIANAEKVHFIILDPVESSNFQHQTLRKAHIHTSLL